MRAGGRPQADGEGAWLALAPRSTPAVRLLLNVGEKQA